MLNFWTQPFCCLNEYWPGVIWPWKRKVETGKKNCYQFRLIEELYFFVMQKYVFDSFFSYSSWIYAVKAAVLFNRFAANLKQAAESDTRIERFVREHSALMSILDSRPVSFWTFAFKLAKRCFCPSLMSLNTLSEC